MKKLKLLCCISLAILTLICISFIPNAEKENYIGIVGIGDSSSYKWSEVYDESGNLAAMKVLIGEMEVAIGFYESGKILTRGFLKYEEMPIGTSTQWYENGQKSQEGIYIEYDTKEGFKKKSKIENITTVNDFYDMESNSNFTSSIVYKYPRTGLWRYWYPNGKLKQIRNYRVYNRSSVNTLEIKEGKWEFFNKEGILIKEIIYHADTVFSSKVFKN